MEGDRVSSGGVRSARVEAEAVSFCDGSGGDVTAEATVIAISSVSPGTIS